MVGFQKPTRCPTELSMTAVAPLSWGATKLVPPYCRTGVAEPDLSYDADPQTGYALYDPQFGSARPLGAVPLASVGLAV
jgi:hypothetical protein